MLGLEPDLAGPGVSTLSLGHALWPCTSPPRLYSRAGEASPGLQRHQPHATPAERAFPQQPQTESRGGVTAATLASRDHPKPAAGEELSKAPGGSELDRGSTQAGAGGGGRPARPGSGFWPPGPGTILDPPPVPLRICEKGAQRPPPPTISVVFLMHVTLGTPGARPSRTDDGVSTGERMRGHRVTSGDIFLTGTSRRPSAETLRRHPPQDSAIDASRPPIWSPVPPHCP